MHAIVAAGIGVPSSPARQMTGISGDHQVGRSWRFTVVPCRLTVGEFASLFPSDCRIGPDPSVGVEP
jgi:hypothetical protein